MNETKINFFWKDLLPMTEGVCASPAKGKQNRRTARLECARGAQPMKRQIDNLLFGRSWPVPVLFPHHTGLGAALSGNMPVSLPVAVGKASGSSPDAWESLTRPPVHLRPSSSKA